MGVSSQLLSVGAGRAAQHGGACPEATAFRAIATARVPTAVPRTAQLPLAPPLCPYTVCLRPSRGARVRLLAPPPGTL